MIIIDAVGSVPLFGNKSNSLISAIHTSQRMTSYRSSPDHLHCHAEIDARFTMNRLEPGRELVGQTC